MMKKILDLNQRYRVLQTIQMKLILLHVWLERVVMGSLKTALKFKYDLSSLTHIQFNVCGSVQA
jgi:hypothetical protein